jgi:hypothetical protein
VFIYVLVAGVLLLAVFEMEFRKNMHQPPITRSLTNPKMFKWILCCSGILAILCFFVPLIGVGVRLWDEFVKVKNCAPKIECADAWDFMKSLSLTDLGSIGSFVAILGAAFAFVTALIAYEVYKITNQTAAEARENNAKQSEIQNAEVNANRFKFLIELYRTVLEDVGCKLSTAKGRAAVVHAAKGLLPNWESHVSVQIREKQGIPARKMGLAGLEEVMDFERYITIIEVVISGLQGASSTFCNYQSVFIAQLAPEERTVIAVYAFEKKSRPILDAIKAYGVHKFVSDPEQYSLRIDLERFLN